MKRLTILTERSEKLIHAYLREGGCSEWIIRGEGREGRISFARVSYAPGGKFAEALTSLLEEAAALENPVYRHSPRLMDIAHDLRGTPVHQENERKLTEFLKYNAAINIEGYVAFRMEDYSYKLDLMTYSLIKKLRTQ